MMIKFERDDGRFYYMSVEKDMFDDLVLLVVRGGSRNRVVHRSSVGHIETIMATIIQLSRRRLQRGYTLVQ
jgi:hypothetical protein